MSLAMTGHQLKMWNRYNPSTCHATISRKYNDTIQNHDSSTAFLKCSIRARQSPKKRSFASETICTRTTHSHLWALSGTFKFAVWLNSFGIKYTVAFAMFPGKHKKETDITWWTRQKPLDFGASLELRKHGVTRRVRGSCEFPQSSPCRSSSWMSWPHVNVSMCHCVIVSLEFGIWRIGRNVFHCLFYAHVVSGCALCHFQPSCGRSMNYHDLPFYSRPEASRDKASKWLLRCWCMHPTWEIYGNMPLRAKLPKGSSNADLRTAKIGLIRNHRHMKLSFSIVILCNFGRFLKWTQSFQSALKVSVWVWYWGRWLKHLPQSPGRTGPTGQYTNGHAWFRWRNKIIATRITRITDTIHHCIMQWSSTCRVSQQLNPFVQHVLVHHQIFNNGHLNFHISFFPPGEFCQGSSHQICTQRAQSKQNWGHPCNVTGHNES